MKLTFPPKKVQIELLLAGALFGALIRMLFVIPETNFCTEADRLVCSVAFNTAGYASYLPFFISLPFIIISASILPQLDLGKFDLLLLMFSYTLIFWLFGSVIWRFKNKKSA